MEDTSAYHPPENHASRAETFAPALGLGSGDDQLTTYRIEDCQAYAVFDGRLLTRDHDDVREWYWSGGVHIGFANEPERFIAIETVPMPHEAQPLGRAAEQLVDLAVSTVTPVRYERGLLAHVHKSQKLEALASYADRARGEARLIARDILTSPQVLPSGIAKLLL